MITIVLIRSGSTDYDEYRRIQGTLNVPLNKQGSTGVLKLAEELRSLGMEIILASTSQSALETAETIAQALDLKVKKLDRMQNLDYGLWQGMLVDEVRVKQPKVYRQWQETPECVCPPEGETLAEADERVHACISRLKRRHKDACIGLVVPEPLASLVSRFLGGPQLGDLWEIAAGQTQWEVFQTRLEAIASGG